MLMAELNYDNFNNDLFMPHLNHWNSQIQYHQISQVTNSISLQNESSLATSDPFLNIALASLPPSVLSTTTFISQDLITTYKRMSANCSYEQFYLYNEVKLTFKPIINVLTALTYFIISVGILFNILNLLVLLNSKLNESPYTYLTILALSDLGALLMVAAEKVRQLFEQSKFVQVGEIDRSN